MSFNMINVRCWGVYVCAQTFCAPGFLSQLQYSDGLPSPGTVQTLSGRVPYYWSHALVRIAIALVNKARTSRIFAGFYRVFWHHPPANLIALGTKVVKTQIRMPTIKVPAAPRTHFIDSLMSAISLSRTFSRVFAPGTPLPFIHRRTSSISLHGVTCRSAFVETPSAGDMSSL